MVHGYNELTGEVGEYTVTHTVSHVDEDIVHLYISGELIETTLDHPFYTDEAMWVEAGALEVGEQILSLDGQYGVVEAVVVVEDANQPMYNLTVDEAHTFFVGEGQWLVHNQGCNEYAPEESGLHWSLQDAIVLGMREQYPDADVVFAARSRAIGADHFDFRSSGIENKPAGTKNAELAAGWKGDCGLRICSGENLARTTYLSDLDVAYVLVNGRNLGDPDFIAMQGGYINNLPLPGARPLEDATHLGNRINTWYGRNVIMHGTAYNGIVNRAPGAYQGLIEEKLFIFNKSGYLSQFAGSGGIDALKILSPDAYQRLMGG